MEPGLLIVLYCLGIVLASLLGGMLPGWIRLTHTRLQLMMSLVAGFMLGIALLHLLPHALAEGGSGDQVSALILVGLLVTFGLIRVFGVHHHGEAGHAHSHAHDHGHSHPHPGPEPKLASMAWIGLALGLALHALLDGVTLAAAVIADARHAPGPGPWGGGTFLAVALHKPLDALSVAAVIRAGGGTMRKVHVVNVGFALMGPVGAAAFWFAGGGLGGVSHETVGMVLAFAAGVFLCVSLADILPEVRFHAHDRLSLSIALLLGVAFAWAIGLAEPDSVHGGAEAPPAAHDHVH